MRVPRRIQSRVINLDNVYITVQKLTLLKVSLNVNARTLMDVVVFYASLTRTVQSIIIMIFIQLRIHVSVIKATNCSMEHVRTLTSVSVGHITVASMPSV